MKRFKTISILSTLALITLSAGACKLEDKLEGKWKIVSATIPGGKNYTGELVIKNSAVRSKIIRKLIESKKRITLTIEPETEVAYELNWNTSAGKYAGLGFYQDNKLYVAWGIRKNSFGVILYEIKKDIIIGKWATGAGQGAGIEELKGDTTTLTGEYTVTGDDPGSTPSEYKGKLSITKRGEVYDLVWNINKKIFKGVGILSNNGKTLVCGYATAGAYGVLQYKIDGKQAKGVWAAPDRDKLGTENLIR